MPDQPTTCPLCGGTGSSPVLTKDGYPIVRCTACGFMYVCPMPTPEAIQAHYQDPAYFAGAAEQGYADYTAMQKALAPHFARRLAVLAQALPERGRLLDVGCAAGFFLQQAHAAGWQIAGVELARDMAAHATKLLDIPIATRLDDLPPGQFDAITLWEVIEHVPDPVAFLRQLVARLQPGGVLMLSTPNTAHWQAQREPQQWISYRPPAHLLYFTEPTLRAAVENAHLQVQQVWRTFPLPPIPAWVQPLSRPLAAKLSSGELPPGQAWQAGLWLWRGVRAGAWGWQRIAHPHDDIFATLELLASRPAA